ncbi:MAG: dihydropteroate synthase [Bacteroidota bacterium]|nr:dihydropteroate synthase [Bacteroidota bacterium]
MNNVFASKKTINIGGELYFFNRPWVMGILNLTEDSFFDGGKYYSLPKALERAEQIIEEGADILDIGACSTRPGAKLVEKKEEIKLLLPVIKEVKKRHPKVIISIDTVWAEVIEPCFDNGADILNDVSGGSWDEDLFSTIAKLKMPYILMHTNNTPDKMQEEINYNNLFMDMCKYFSERLLKLKDLGVKDVILDLGFGFGKTLQMNYELLRRQQEFKDIFSLPILTGISRKSMIYKPIDQSPKDVLTQSCFLHALALENGADILRVHDVKQTVDCLKLYKLYKGFEE